MRMSFSQINATNFKTMLVDFDYDELKLLFLIGAMRIDEYQGRIKSIARSGSNKSFIGVNEFYEDLEYLDMDMNDLSELFIRLKAIGVEKIEFKKIRNVVHRMTKKSEGLLKKDEVEAFIDYSDGITPEIDIKDLVDKLNR